ncbi:IEC3 subunit of the Ino80 complex, chromatin re-modelling-domain-containing protein [Limtongia smithiae]|uniref:IEC3 subunit of the Ino80 complex, chromatin re-modelling-domain-containing protein n=1 Tax=Limtongia smithiae TaxID=1125753 RepID=UPI0034CD0446
MDTTDPALATHTATSPLATMAAAAADARYLPQDRVTTPIPTPIPVTTTTIPAAGAGSPIARAPYKSFRKKYRKLRLQFDTVMRENEELRGLDMAARRTLRRLNVDNSRLLDMLVDISIAGHVDARLAVDGLGQGGAAEMERQGRVMAWLRERTREPDAERVELDSRVATRGLLGVTCAEDDAAELHDLTRLAVPDPVRAQMQTLQNDFDADY